MVTTIRLPDKLQDEAKRYAEAVGCSLNGLVGMALRDYLNRHSVTAPGVTPQVAPGVTHQVSGREFSLGNAPVLEKPQEPLMVNRKARRATKKAKATKRRR
jgi:predicted transcriptional regulator